MKMRILASVAVMSLALVVSTAWAYPKEGKGKAKRGQTAAKVESGCDKPCGHKHGQAHAQTVSSTCDGRSETASDAKCGCGEGCTCSKCKGDCGKCQGDCGKCKGDCDKGCTCGKCKGGCGKATLTADTKCPGCGCGKECTCGEECNCGKDCTCGKCKGAAHAKGKACGCGKADCGCGKARAAAHAEGGGCSCGKGKTAAHAKSKTCGCGKADCTCGKGKTIAQAKSTGCGNCPKAAADESEGGCPIGKKVKAILASMPAMKYRVGNDVTGCSKRAASLAEGNGHAIEYVVGNQTFVEKGEAAVKLAAMLDEEIESLQKMKYVTDGKALCCPKTAKRTAEKANTTITYRVAGFDFDTQEDAEKALESIHEALENVPVRYKVGGEIYDCGKTAGANSADTGKELIYVIGDEETGCWKSATLMLREAKVQAAVEAAAKTYAHGS